MLLMYDQCMTTINVSLPAKLKIQADNLVKSGYYASFSDLVRDSLRRLIEKSKYDLSMDETKEDLKTGQGIVLNSKKEVDSYLNEI